MTLPAGMLALLASVTVPSARPAPVSAAVAADWVSPTTLGTATVPLLIATFTAAAVSMITPAAGLWLMMLPTGTVALLCIVTVPSLSPAAVSAVVAAAWVSPTTFGAATVGMDFVAVLSTSLLQLASNPMNNKVSARLCQCECLLNLNLAPVCGALGARR